jgi:hypothetical protein
MFKIESGIPLKVTGRGRAPTTSFPLDEDKKTVESWRRKFLNAKKRFVRDHADADFRSGVVNDEHGTGLRVWCTA